MNNRQRVLAELDRLAAVDCGVSSLTCRAEVAEAREGDKNSNVTGFVARSHAKVIGHYNRLLAIPSLTPAERADLESRLAHELDGPTRHS